MIRLALAGASGRLGRCVLDACALDQELSVAVALGGPRSSLQQYVEIGSERIRLAGDVDEPCDVLVDVSTAEATSKWLEICVDKGMPIVIGATGHSESQLAKIQSASSHIAVLCAANFSVGFHVMRALARQAVQLIGGQCKIEIVETHHGAKRDAPSGSARTLVEDLSSMTSETNRGSGDAGRTGASDGQSRIGMHSLRMGHVVGRHEVHVGMPYETVSLVHDVQSRDVFAQGAVLAVRWIVRQPPGLYEWDPVVLQAI